MFERFQSVQYVPERIIELLAYLMDSFCLDVTQVAMVTEKKKYEKTFLMSF